MSRILERLPDFIEDVRKLHSPDKPKSQASFTPATFLDHVTIKKPMQIEKNIPIPPTRRKGSICETLRRMEVGDSVVLPKGKDIGWRSSAKTLGMKVAARKISGTECRLWRVA